MKPNTVVIKQRMIYVDGVLRGEIKGWRCSPTARHGATGEYVLIIDGVEQGRACFYKPLADHARWLLERCNANIT